MDKRLTGICAKLGWTYTRYADDMSFSGGDEQVPKVGYLLARVRHILQDEGFQLNAKKTRVLYPSAAQTVTGIVVNRRPAVRRRVARRVRAILHHAAREGLEAQNRHNHPHFESWLQGMIAYIGMVNPAQAVKELPGGDTVLDPAKGVRRRYTFTRAFAFGPPDPADKPRPKMPENLLLVSRSMVPA